MEDHRTISIRCMPPIDPVLDVGYTGYRGRKLFKLFYQKTRTYGILFLYLYIINKRDMREAIKDLIIKWIVLSIALVVIPIAIAYYIDSTYISVGAVLVYGIFIACFFEIK